jgi:type IV pilus assembly protein PilV
MQYRLYQQGVTLIEVLMAMVVCSVGLIGVAGLLVLSARSNHAAYLRTQVSFLAQGMVDRMQANPIGVWDGVYNGTYPNGTSQDCEAGCTPTQLARHDQGEWSSQLRVFLPAGAKATVACSSAGVAYIPRPEQLGLRPPYGGSCRMTVTWTESGVGAAGSKESDSSPQTFAWAFQP